MHLSSILILKTKHKKNYQINKKKLENGGIKLRGHLAKALQNRSSNPTKTKSALDQLATFLAISNKYRQRLPSRIAPDNR